MGVRKTPLAALLLRTPLAVPLHHPIEGKLPSDVGQFACTRELGDVYRTLSNILLPFLTYILSGHIFIFIDKHVFNEVAFK